MVTDYYFQSICDELAVLLQFVNQAETVPYEYKFSSIFETYQQIECIPVNDKSYKKISCKFT